jgi:hypothetical protein
MVGILTRGVFIFFLLLSFSETTAFSATAYDITLDWLLSGNPFCYRRRLPGGGSGRFLRISPNWFLGVLADDRDRLGGRNVVTRIPVFIAGGGVEVLLDKLFSPRQSVAAAHGEIIADQRGVSRSRSTLAEWYAVSLTTAATKDCQRS